MMCIKLIDDGPNCQGLLNPRPLNGQTPRGLLVTVEFMLTEGRTPQGVVPLNTRQYHRFFAAVAHQVEQQTENLCVAGSSPARGTSYFLS